jgi:hypothetical protein
MDLKNKTVIVTGAAMGIGKACAVLFQEYGAHVIIADMNEEEGKKAEIKCNFIPNKNGGHIRFVNAGKSDARNVHVEIITPKDELEGLIIDKWEDYELINPQSYREELVGLCIGSPDYIKLKVIWEDDYSKDRTAILSVQL